MLKKWPLFPIVILGTALIFAVASLVMKHRPNEAIGLLRANNSEYVTLGSSIYKANCAACHGANLEGQVRDWQTRTDDGFLPAPPHDETGHTWHHTDQLLFDITKYGVAKAANLENYKSAMPAYESLLSDKEIIAVLSYIKSKWSEDTRKNHDKLNERFEKKE